MSNPLLRWKTPTAFPNLKKRHAHIWCAVLDYSDDQLANFFTLLAADEQTRAQRFHFDKDRSHFIASHGVLRKILSGYLNIAPQKLNFTYNEFGKPFLIDHPELQFNLSHSENIALVAITLNYLIGVDIEYMKRD